MNAFWFALLTAQKAALVIGPLRIIDFDDQDYTFFAYDGLWRQGNGAWPGGSRNDTVTFRAAVVPSEVLPIFTTKVITFQGTADEGIDLWGSAEDGGLLLFFIRALDQTNSGWVQFGDPVGSLTYRFQWKPSNLPTDPAGDRANYNLSYLGQSYYSNLSNPGIIKLRGLPPGRYQFRVHKLANTTDPNDNGNKALYFDGATVYTCDPNFS